MAQLILELPDLYYQRLEEEARKAGKAIEGLILDWILQIPENDESYDVNQDPLYNFEGFETSAPSDLSINADKYLYGEQSISIFTNLY